MSISRTMSIVVSKNAWSKISEILGKTNHKYGFLYSASSGGCNGFNFELNPLSEDLYQQFKKQKFLTILTPESSDEPKVYVDPISEMYLHGTKIDYIKEDFSKGQYENKFVYEVDKELMTSCGCGVSFSPK